MEPAWNISNKQPEDPNKNKLLLHLPHATKQEVETRRAVLVWRQNWCLRLWTVDGAGLWWGSSCSSPWKPLLSAWLQLLFSRLVFNLLTLHVYIFMFCSSCFTCLTVHIVLFVSLSPVIENKQSDFCPRLLLVSGWSRNTPILSLLSTQKYCFFAVAVSHLLLLL